MLMSERMKQAQKDIQKLGIINIEASGDLTPDVICDAVAAVKEVNLNFKELSAQAARYRKAPER